MYTSFVTDTRKAISDCWNSVQDIHKQQAQNDTRYQGEYLTEQNKRLDEQKKAACEAARKKIASICDKADEDAATLDTLNPFAVSDDYAAIAMVRKGLGITIIPELILRGIGLPIRAMELEPKCIRTICIAAKAHTAVSPACRAFIAFARSRLAGWDGEKMPDRA